MKKKPAPVKFYVFVENGDDGDRKYDVICADKKSDLFTALETMIKPTVLSLVRGRMIKLQQKMAYRI